MIHLLSELNNRLEPLGVYLEDTMHTPDCLQKFIESDLEFFNGSTAKDVIEGMPAGMKSSDKLMALITSQGQIIGFFELLFHYPNRVVLENETEGVLEKIGSLDARRVNLSYLILSESTRNKGIGSKLLKVIEIVLGRAGYQYIHLVVDDANKKARSFYARHGYQNIKSRPSTTKLGHTDLILVKVISQSSLQILI